MCKQIGKLPFEFRYDTCIQREDTAILKGNVLVRLDRMASMPTKRGKKKN